MAIYHLHGQVIKRSAGKSAIASAAYRRATKLYDEIAEKNWDYSKKEHVIHSELLIPKNAPAWAQELMALHSLSPSQASAKLWNLVEARENLHNSQLAREIEFALPIELTPEQNLLLAREFIQDQFVLRGMIADWSVHWDEGNPHVHVMLTMRALNENGFGNKVREWNQKTLLIEWRKQWAEYANFHLRQHRHDIKIDHRSYEAQGINLIPSIHQGKAVTDMDRRGIDTNIMQEANGIRRENLARISKNPEILLDKLSVERESFSDHHLGQELGRYINDRGQFSIQEKIDTVSENHKSILSKPNSQEPNTSNVNAEFSEIQIPAIDASTPKGIAYILKSIEHYDSVFTENTIAKALAPITNNAKDFAKALIQIKASPELIFLGPGDDGRDRYTTKTMFRLENKIQNRADQLRKRFHEKISDKKIEKVLNQHQKNSRKKLTDEQIQAVKHIVAPSSLTCLVGRAGTGKSFSLGAAKAIWESQDLRVQGVTLSGIAADGLQKEVGIESRTIESFRYSLAQGRIKLDSKDVIVMDEAGMTDSVSMQAILDAVKVAKAKLVLVGDHAQIQPVGPGASFRALIERLGFAELQTVYRQEAQWQREATMAFSTGRMAQGLNAFEAKKCVHFGENEEGAMALLVNDWMKARKENRIDPISKSELSRYLVLAHRNKDVQALNSLLRDARIHQDEISQGYAVHSDRGEIKISKGDRILFLKNNRALGVSNGRLATIESVKFTESGQVTKFKVCLDGSEKKLWIDPKAYSHFTYGYASTVHKAQGVTVDFSFVFAGGKGWVRHLTYVALSRHRKSCHLYADKSLHKNFENLKRNLGRFGMKDSVLDFPLAFAERRGINTESLLKSISMHLVNRLKKLKNKIEKVINPPFYSDRKIPEKKNQNPSHSIQWQSTEYSKEFEKLRSIKDSTVNLMVEFYDLLKKEKNPKEIESISRSMHNLAQKITQKHSFDEVKRLSIKLSQAMEIASKSHSKTRDHNIDR